MCITHLFYVHLEAFLSTMNARGTVAVMLNSPSSHRSLPSIVASVNSLPFTETPLRYFSLLASFHGRENHVVNLSYLPSSAAT